MNELPHPEADRLVIAYAFPPYADTSSIVAGKRVHQHGVPVDLVQNDLESLRPADPSLETIVQGLLRRRAVLPTPTAFSGWLSISAFCQEGLPVIEQWEAERGRPYPTVYSRAHFVASHFLAARYVADRPGTSWEAEFSDPLSRNAQGGTRHSPVRENELLQFCRATLTARGFTGPGTDNVYEWCEHLTFALADRLVFTNTAQRDYMLQVCTDRALAALAADKAEVAAQPTLPPNFYTMLEPDYPLEPGRVHIGYFGNFYASRNAGAILHALAGLDRADRDRLCLHVFTSRHEELAEQVAAQGIGGAVVVRPFAPYLEFLALSRRMDVLLALDATTPKGSRANPFLLSKWSDYRGAGTPVWGVVDEGSALSRQTLAYRSPLDHTTAAQQVLVSLARDGVRDVVPG